MSSSPTSLVFNGINAATGDYLLPPLPAEVIGRIARGEKLDERHLEELRYRFTRKNKTYLGPKAGVDPNKLEEAGWGVIFAHNASPAVREALLPLLKLRGSQAGKYYQEFGPFAECSSKKCKGLCGYRTNETKGEFLARHGAGPGPADPDNVPYYLLIVGDPEDIPFRFQYQLDVQYAVGRIAFDDVESYANYAASVVEAETRPLSLSRKAVFFAASNPDDDATSLSSSDLVGPLFTKVAATPSWEFEKIVADGATKAALGEVLGGANTPGFLFTATHGVGFPEGDRRQLRHQGALLCQDWPGPSWKQPIPESFYFSGDDVGRDANPFGLIAFFFACYGAGTPRLDDFAHAAFKETRPAIAPHAFLAGLPRRLLSHPKGGALAVVGHVDRAWSYSFHWERAGSQVQTFEAAIKLMLEGRPLGSAVEFFNERYAELSSDLTDKLEAIRWGETPNDYELAGMWTANNDSRSYVIIGDPAVRLPVAQASQIASPRPVLSLAELPQQPVPFQPTSTPILSEAPTLTTSVLSVFSATEQRFQTRASERPPASYAPGQAEVVQKNPPQRIRKRLARLGVSEGEIDALFAAGGMSYAPIAPVGSKPSLARVALERIIGRNDLIGVEFLEAALNAAGSVGHVLVKSRSGRVLGHGSGVMVSPRLFLTNNHVLETDASAGASEVQFGYQYEPGGRLRPGRSFRFAHEEFFLTDPALDFTLVAVRVADGLGEFGHVTLNDDDGRVLVGEYMNIVQHPNGLPKQLAFRDNQVTDLLDDFVHYRADTEPGSSGSPVFNDQWEMVALHHSGVPKRNSQNHILARNGSVWTEEQGDFAIDWIANEGVRVGRILSFLREARLPDPYKPLRDDLLSTVLSGNGQPPVSQPAERCPNPIVPQSRASSGIRVEQSPAGSDFSSAVSVTVPVRITVSIDSPDRSAVTATGITALRAAEGRFEASGYIASPFSDQFATPSLSKTTPGWDTHLSLALASHLAYADEATVVDMARSLWQMETCDFLVANATHCFIASTAEVILISFRGTASVANWLANMNVRSKARPYGNVHRGFYLAFADIQPLLERRLEDFTDRPIVLTGHSLGGALATIAGAEWQGARTIGGIHTFGQPAVGNKAFRDFLNGHYGDSFFRFVNDDDIVPRVPPGYVHVGRLLHFDESGDVSRERASLVEAVGADGTPTMTEPEFAQLQARLRAQGPAGPAPLGEAARTELEGFLPSIRDHSLDRYIEKILSQI
jgi:V8-like Glu-specific endopeptidase